MKKEKEKLLSCLNSDDKEVVELYVNILYQKGVKMLELINILKKSKYKIFNKKGKYIYIEFDFIYIMREQDKNLIWAGGKTK